MPLITYTWLNIINSLHCPIKFLIIDDKQITIIGEGNGVANDAFKVPQFVAPFPISKSSISSIFQENVSRSQSARWKYKSYSLQSNTVLVSPKLSPLISKVLQNGIPS